MIQRMSRRMPLILLLAISWLCGCDQSQPPPHVLAPAVASVPKQVDYQRFIPVPRQPESLRGVPWSGALALDTMTGQLCRTYDEEVSLEDGPKAFWATLPLCRSLWANNPESKQVSLAEAMKLPRSKGKSADEVRRDIESFGYRVVP
jgi:hypothetical protein